MTNAVVVVRPRFVLSFPPDSNRLSSNIGCLPAEHYEFLDTRDHPLVPNSGVHSGRQNTFVQPYRANLVPKTARSTRLSVSPLALSAHSQSRDLGLGFRLFPPGPSARRHDRRLVPLSPPILICDQDGSGNCDRRIRPD